MQGFIESMIALLIIGVVASRIKYNQRKEREAGLAKEKVK